MGLAMQLLTGRVTNPGAALTAATMDTGDSNTVRSFPFGTSPAYIDNLWAFGATAGAIRVRSPRLHDVSQGVRLRYSASNPAPLLPDYARQLLLPQDVLIMEQSGGGAEVDMFTALAIYEDLPGVQAQLSTWDQISPRVKNLAGVECNLTTSATAGQYGGGQALNANFDTLKRNVSYAVLGYTLDTPCCTLGIQGPDLGNLRVGGPGSTRHELTSGWFCDLSVREGKPMIPVINSANIANTIVDVATPATAAAINVTFMLAELG